MGALVVDVLKEVRRRQVEIDSARGVNTAGVKYSPSNELNQALTKMNLSRASALSDDEPLYDSVASDDDYYIISAHALIREGGGYSDGRTGSPLASHGSPL